MGIRKKFNKFSLLFTDLKKMIQNIFSAWLRSSGKQFMLRREFRWQKMAFFSLHVCVALSRFPHVCKTANSRTQTKIFRRCHKNASRKAETYSFDWLISAPHFLLALSELFFQPRQQYCQLSVAAHLSLWTLFMSARWKNQIWILNEFARCLSENSLENATTNYGERWT